MHENDPRRIAPGAFHSNQILSQEPALHGHIQCRRDGQGDEGVGDHEASVVDQRIHLRAVKHAEARDLRGHIDAVDGDAAEVVDREPSGTAQDRTRKNAPAFPPEEARQPQAYAPSKMSWRVPKAKPASSPLPSPQRTA